MHEWLNKYKIRLEELPEPRVMFTHLEHEQVFKYQKAFGYSTEDLKPLLHPWHSMAKNRSARWEPICHWLC